MAQTASIGMYGDKVVIGALDTSFLPGIPKVLPGTLVSNGPCYFGLVPNIGVPMATVMIGPPMSFPAPLSLQVHGISQFYGIVNVFAVSTFTGLTTKLGTTIKNALSLKNGVDIKNALGIGNAITQKNGNVNIAGTLTVAGVITCPTIVASLGTFASVSAPFKFFDIPHPSKEFPHRLRYSCLEGPEIGVYLRGVLKGENVIELPYYWNDLVDDESITVNLTPIGVHQNLCYTVVREDKLKVIVNPHSSRTHNIRCSYTVFAERKDVSKLVTEYEGRET